MDRKNNIVADEKEKRSMTRQGTTAPYGKSTQYTFQSLVRKMYPTGDSPLSKVLRQVQLAILDLCVTHRLPRVKM